MTSENESWLEGAFRQAGMEPPMGVGRVNRVAYDNALITLLSKAVEGVFGRDEVIRIQNQANEFARRMVAKQNERDRSDE